MGVPYATSISKPSRKSFTSRWRSSLPAATSCIAAVAVTSFEIDATRTIVRVPSIGRRASRSAQP